MRKLFNNTRAIVAKLLCLALIAMVFTMAAFAQTDPAEIVTSASGKYNTAVAVYLSAAVIGAAILFIRKGLRGRM